LEIESANPKIIEVPVTPKIKVLVAVPATATEHLPFQKEILEAIDANLKDVPHDLFVGEANNDGWGFVVDAWNQIADRVVAEKYDYVWIIESDVVPPENAFNHLLSQSADVAAAVVPVHEYADPVLQKALKDVVCVSTFENADTLAQINLHMQDVENKVLWTSTNPLLFTGTGCILIKRAVFESGIRFILDLSHASHDVFFWRDIVKKGFLGAVDGFVICKHFGS
jgi:GT2 family glycosyltransferase